MARPISIDREEVMRLTAEGVSQNEISKKLGCSQGYVSRLSRDLGLTEPGRMGRNPSGRGNAQKVIDHITVNGGSLRNAILLLDLNVCDATVRKLAKEQGIDLYTYRHVGTKRRNWAVVKPGFSRASHSEPYIIPVQCTNCGHEMTMKHHQLVKARPGVCPCCGAS